jgi:hypothetical protein
MNMTRLFTIMLTAACLLVCIPLASAAAVHDTGSVPSAGNHIVTVEEAKESVRIFQDNRSAEPVYLTEEVSESVTYYVFALGPSVFLVNADNGIVEIALFEENEPAFPTVMKIDRDEAYAKAVEYADTKYNGFSTKTWAVHDYRLDYYHEGTWGYVFSFTEMSRSGNETVVLPTMVEVDVNPETGAVYLYQSMNRIPVKGSDLPPMVTGSPAWR